MRSIIYIIIVILTALFLQTGCTVGSELIELKKKLTNLTYNMAVLETQQKEAKEKSKELNEKISTLTSKIKKLEEKVKKLKLPSYEVYTEKNRITFIIKKEGFEDK